LAVEVERDKVLLIVNYKIDMEETDKLILNFNSSITTTKLKDFYRTTSLMEIYGISRKEIKHTSFLKWLFGPDCEISKKALRKMLYLIITSKHFKKEMLNDELYKLIVVGNFEIDRLDVDDNYTIAGKEKLDLFIELSINSFKLDIIIENKIYSREFEDQTQRYYDRLNKSKPQTSKLFIYLSPISAIELDELDEPLCCCKSYIQLNYQVLVDKIIEPLLSENINKTTKFFLEDYLKALSTPVNVKQKNYSFMAISNSESELLTKFWIENEVLIGKAVEATKSNPHIEPAIRKMADQISNLMINEKDERVGAYVKRNLLRLFSENKIDFEEVKRFQDFSHSHKTFHIQYPLLKKVTNRAERPIHYWKDIVLVGNEEFYICCEWFDTKTNNDREHFDTWLKSIDK